MVRGWGIICPVVHPRWSAGRLKFGDRECEALVVLGGDLDAVPVRQDQDSHMRLPVRDLQLATCLEIK